MRFTPSFLEEIKARLPVSEVVRRRVKLTKAGREWKGLSPFSAEKTPSFFVNDQKMAWFDFSSGQNGNIFDFLMRTEGLSFPEAVERLARDAGLDLPVVSEEAQRQERRRAGLQEVLELSAQFFQQQLQGRAGAKARGYLADRGLGPDVQAQFRIGYAPDEKFALRDWLAAKDASVETMCEGGMLIHGEEIAVPYDRFRDRVMFPICDRSGKVIAFGGRALEKDVPAKYLNSPETPLFHKGATLYNHHNARKAAHDKGAVIAVEGYVDVIAMTGAGFPNVVAPLGTALTPDQCELLWRMAEEPILCFDGDKAGRKAAHRAIDTALPLLGPGRSLRFAFLPDGQDPDDLARSGGREAVARVIEQARPLVEVLWTREAEAGPLDTPERWAALHRRLSEKLREIKDETLRRYYQDDMRQRLSAARNPGRQGGGPGAAFGQFRPRQGGQGGQGGRGGRFQQVGQQAYRLQPVPASALLQKTAAFAGGSGTPPREAQILLTLIHHPGLLARHVEDLAELELTSRDAARLRDALTHLAMDAHERHEGVRADLEAIGLSAELARLEAVDVVSSLWCVLPGAAEEDAGESLRQALALHRRARALHRELKSAETELGRDATDQNLDRLREIQSELAALEGREAAVEGFGLMSGRQTRVL
ncbi:MAG: DNA primase [Beijerinckiaceae bacterium]|nr:DNA primase [Beijerinckiaceae bacterium]